MRKIHMGIIGAGWFATANHIPVLARRSDVELTAVCRLGKKELSAIQEKYGFLFATEDYRELLELPLDGVIVSSPHDMHYEHAAAALQRGMHVACEKPMTLDPAHAWELVELARENKCHLLVPYGWNYKPFVKEARDLLNCDSIGRIEHVTCRMASPTRSFFAGNIGMVPSAWAPTVTAPEPDTWQNNRRGGGYAYGQISHAGGLLFYLTDLRVHRTACVMSAPKSNVDLYDSAIVEFEGGAIGTIAGSATLPEGEAFQLALQIFGDAGVLSIDAEAGRERVTLTRSDRNNKTVQITPGDGAYSCVDPINTFVDLIQGRSENRSAAEVGARAVELVDAMHRSARDGGQFVSIDAQSVRRFIKS